MAENAEKLSSTKYGIKTNESNFSTIIKDFLKQKKNFIVYIYGDLDSNG